MPCITPEMRVEARRQANAAILAEYQPMFAAGLVGGRICEVCGLSRIGACADCNARLAPDLWSKGLDPDGPLVPLPAPQPSAGRVFVAPAHDYLAALHRPYVPPA